MQTVHVRLDHLVWAAGDLDAGAARMAARVGMVPRPGGSHPQWGTRNRLLGLEDGAYLEVVAPDPNIAVPEAGRAFGVDTAGEGGLVTWAARCDDLREAAHRLDALGVEPGEVASGQRVRPDGRVLRWTQTDPTADRLGGAVPFLLDWGSSPHPSSDLAREDAVAGSAVRIELRHPQPERVLEALRAIEDPNGVAVTVTSGPWEIAAELRTHDGRTIRL